MRPVDPSARYEKNSALPHTCILPQLDVPFPTRQISVVAGDRPEVEVIGGEPERPTTLRESHAR